MTRPMLRLRKRLDARPAACRSGEQRFGPVGPKLELRCFEGSTDVTGWCRLHQRVFGQTASRRWRDEDFVREFLAKPWWRADCMWLAATAVPAAPALIGGIAVRPIGATAGVAQVTWLMVDPDWRRLGVASRLLACVADACGSAGFRELQVETLVSWEPAVGCYRAAGFRPVDTTCARETG